MKLKNFETYLNKAGLLSLAVISVEEAIQAFNSEYGTNYNSNDLNENLNDYLKGFISVMLFGWSNANFEGLSDEIIDRLKNTFSSKDENGESLNDYEKYAGIDATTQKEIEGKNFTDEELEKYIDNRTNVIFEGLGIHAFTTTMAELAKLDKRNIVGSISMRDKKVRKRHAILDNHVWKNGTILNPNDEFNCRCRQYYFRTFEEATKAGFEKL